MSEGSAAAPARIPSEVSAENTSDKLHETLHIAEILFIAGDLLLQTIFLAVGIFIASQPYREALVKAQPRTLDYAFAWIMAFLSYTFTNLAILSCLSAIAGAGARRVEAQLAGSQRLPNLRALYTSAAIRGFFVYLIALSGLMFLAEGLFTTIAKTPDVYIRMAASISVLSFMLGFNPEMFSRFLERIARILEDEAARTKA